MKQKKFEKGVTLIALVVTIIVILIIAGISLSALTGQDSGLKVGEETKTEVNVDEEKNVLRLAVQETMNADSKGEINEEPFREHLDQHVKPENYDNFEYRENSKSYILQMVPTQNWYTITKDGEVLDGKVNLPMIVIDNESLNLEWEEVKQLTAVMRSDDGDEPITDAIWRSSDLSVATVDDNGLVTAQRKSGTITITVEKDGLIAECVVVVKNTVKVLELDKTEYTIDLSGEKTLQVVGKYYPEDADTGINLTYTIADTSVATVDENGLITGLKNGETELTLSNELGLSTIATVKVVTSPTGITLDRESVTTTGSFQLTATITPDTANVNTDITWSSSNSNVASVDSSGYVRRVSSGYAVITATTGNGKTAQCQVTMKSTSYSSGGGGSSSGGGSGGSGGSGQNQQEDQYVNDWSWVAAVPALGVMAGLVFTPVGGVIAAVGALAVGTVATLTGHSKKKVSSSSGGGNNKGSGGGGGNKGNQLIQFGGSINSIAATLAPVLGGYLIGNLAGAQISNANPVFYLAMGIFAAAFIVLALSKIPEPYIIKKEEGQAKEKHSALSFRHFKLGIIAIFIYVGVEVGIPNIMNLFMTDPASGAGIDPTIAGTVVGTYWLLMLVGRLIGGVLGGKISSKAMLTAVSTLGIILICLAIFLPSHNLINMPVFKSDLSFGLAEVPVNCLLLVLCGLCTSVMWGGIFNLAVEGLGKYTSAASGIFMMMVCGGGILPAIQGAIADGIGFLNSYWLLVAGLAYILFFAVAGSRNVNKDIPTE